jgi:hypothetical protein
MKNFNEHPVNMIPYNKRNENQRVIELSSWDFKEVINTADESCDSLLAMFLHTQLRRSEFFCDKKSPVRQGKVFKEQTLEHFDYHALFEYNWDILCNVYNNTIDVNTKVYAYVLSEEFYEIVNTCTEFLKLLTEPSIKDVDWDLLKKDLTKMNTYIKEYYKKQQ